MQKEGVKPDKVIFVSVLNACISCDALQEGKRIHACIVDRGWEKDVIVGTALFQMYSKCGSLEDARRIFSAIVEKDVITWTAMITTYTHYGDDKAALQLFSEMQQKGVKPNKVTYISILNACATPLALPQGRLIHSKIVAEGFESDVVVGTALLQMYAKCGSLEDSWKIFKAMPTRNVITWNALITANVHRQYGESALSLFKQMEEEGIGPDKVTFVSILDACAILGFLAEGKRIHAQILGLGLESDVMLGTALISMYGKCGTFEEARWMFEKVSNRDTICWTSMIATCTQHGYDREALQLFGQMQSNGMKPDEVAFLGVLSACSHAGFVDDGWHYFHSMKEDAKIIPQAEHYGCMVDLYGRAGLLDEAQAIVCTLPFQANAVVWMSFLGACRVHQDVKRGRLAAEHLLELEPQTSSPYVVLSNTYAATGKWENVEKVRKAMIDRRVKKQPGRSSIEINDKIHEFIVGDRSHPEVVEIYAELERLNTEMKKLGYVPDTNLVLHDVEEEDKADLLSLHSEKLAISFGLLNMPGDMPIRVIKNLRVCSDCHTASKFISKIVKREIVLRDPLRFHHFKGGICSCGDYW
ncbi:hypothetical protein O6H91_23G067500 [Diphasiastrum complanatum]|nr:hypothetical protein O6H91_23G067500 [Diphasiastrum complanatum]